MSGPKRTLTPEERALWRKVSRTARPLPAGGMRVQPPVNEEVFAALLRGRSGTAPAALNAGTVPRSAPVERGAERKVRRGRVEIDARIDLHGETADHARQMLLAFLSRAAMKGHQTILVITGKGAAGRAEDSRRFEPWTPDAPSLPGVLRRSLPLWLAEPDFAVLVSGYAPAHARHGGSGAFYVMLRA
ncbi:Smr/MutS family protein [Glycocaulis sp.]|uniref:Smr/MutS family protein n=1 Tax=Glycocaulis sp. TaxID=1969725 RepID=UPI003F714805